MSALQQTSDAREPGFPFAIAMRSEEKAEVSDVLTILATLKAILIAASVAFARGDMLPVTQISILFNLALSPPDMLVRAVAVPRQRLQTAAVGRLKSDGNSCSHAPDSHAFRSRGIPSRIQMSDAIH
jgi:hypothetical protein